MDIPGPKKLPTHDGSESAAEFIRAKIQKLYSSEPDAREEIAKEEAVQGKRSKHQQYMHQLNHSGKSLAEIQTEWHNYYVNLPDSEKHEVWQEFYSTHAKATARTGPQVLPMQQTQNTPETPQKSGSGIVSDRVELPPEPKRSTVTQLKFQLLDKVQSRVNISAKKKGHLHSLGFGLSMGLVVMAFMLFGFFNERFIAPFITPSRTVSSAPIIIDPNISNVGPEAKIIIPKINLDIPVIYDEPSIDEDAVQRALEKGALHYPTTAKPGELGNGVIFGHSSSNILNSGKYKFAFVLLRQLETGDTFYIHKDGKRYVYKVYNKYVVAPTEVSVLNAKPNKAATFTLITCDPPGSSLNRLVVEAEQISPDPSTNTPSSAQTASVSETSQLPSDAPTLWQRFKKWIVS